MLAYKILSKDDFPQYSDDLAYMRLEYFSTFPYLYVGSKADEQIYLSGYLNHPEGRIIIVLKDNHVVGMATGFPLHRDMNEKANSTKWVRTVTQLDKEKIPTYFYLGEVIVKPSVRKEGTAYHLTKFIENNFSKRGYQKSTLITVERSTNHPLAPSKYFPMEYTLKKLQYTLMGIRADVAYATKQPDGSVKSSDNTMIFWEKTL